MTAWASVELAEVCTLITDGTHHSPINLSVGDYKYVTAKNIRPWGLDISNITYVDSATHQGIYARCPVEYGDVLYIKDGVTTGIAALNSLEEPFSMLSSVALLKPERNVLEPRYLKHWLNSPVAYSSMTGEMTGTAIKRLVLKQIRATSIQLAPLPEQTRIADKLDSVLARVDACRDRLDRLPALLKRFRQSILAAATSGRLTEDWRFEKLELHETATAQLYEIIENRGNHNKKGKPPEAHLKHEEFVIPSEWLWTSLDALSSKIVDGTHHTPTYLTSGTPFISVKDIKNGKINFTDTKFISREEHCELSKRCPVSKGDLLITKSGTIGRTAIVATDQEFSLFVSVAVIKPASDKVNLRFIDIALQSWIANIDISSRIVGTAIKNLHLSDMKVLSIPFPTLNEQTEIVRRVELLFAFADRLEARLATARRQVGQLTPALLAKAFRGELVAQDPADEPAAELLKRLAAQREAAPKAKRGRAGA